MIKIKITNVEVVIDYFPRTRLSKIEPIPLDEVGLGKEVEYVDLNLGLKEDLKHFVAADLGLL